MANKNFEIKNGLTVAGTERITSAGLVTGTTTTQAASDNTTKLASTAYVTTALAALADSAPSTLNTLNELAAALGDDANYSTTTTAAIAAKAPLASPTLTGSLNVVPTAATGLTYAADGTNTYINFKANSVGDSVQLYAGQSSGGFFSIGTKNSSGTLAEKMRVTPTGNVGIGTSSPFSSARLQVKTTTNVNLGFQTGTTLTNGFKINAYNDAGSANIPLEINGSVVLLKTGETEKMRIDASGEVFVGKTASSNTAKGFTVDQDGLIQTTKTGSGGQCVFLNRQDSDGIHILFRKANSTVGSISTTGGDLTIDSGSEHTGLQFQASDITPRHNGADANNYVDLGTTGARFKDGHFGGSLYAHSGNFVIATDSGGSYMGKAENATLRLITNNTTRITIRNDGGIGIGNNNAGYSSQILSVKAAGADTVFYGESTDANCIMSVRDNSSNKNVGFGATGNAHVFSQDGTAIASLSTGTANKLGYAGNGTLLKLEADDSQIRMANQVIHADNSGNTIFHIRNNYGVTSHLAELSLESGHITFNAGTSQQQTMRIDAGRVDVNGQVTGGFGGATTAGTADWNHSTNARAGMGYTLLLGTATNGPGLGVYYHIMGYEYVSKNGNGNLTQMAIPYNHTDCYIRYRYSGTWSSWALVA
jgi:hypothetical protein